MKKFLRIATSLGFIVSVSAVVFVSAYFIVAASIVSEYSNVKLVYRLYQYEMNRPALKNIFIKSVVKKNNSNN